MKFESHSVILLGPYKGFSKTNGSGVNRYAYELHKNLQKITRNVVDKLETTRLFGIGTGLSFSLLASTNRYKNYRIVHNLFSDPMLHLSQRKIFITTIHEMQMLLNKELNQDMESGFKNQLWLNLIGLPGLKLSLKSDYVIVPSIQASQEVASTGFDSKRIFIVNNGIDERFLKPILKKRHRKFIVGYVGALRRRKNVVFAIRAFKKISDIDIEFHIYGKPAYDYKEIYKEALSDKRIIFKGFADEKKLVDVYDSFDVFVFPTLYESHSPLLLEARARGLPTIIYRNSIMSEENRKFCFEAEDESHMARIIETLKINGFKEELRNKQIQYAQKFTWMKTAKDTATVYKKILLKH